MNVNGHGANLPEIATKSSKIVAPRKFNFTKEKLNNLPGSANGQRAYYHDTRVRGLCLAVSPKGKKVFVLYKKICGRPERVNIGVFPDWSIENARGAAEGMNSAIVRGENPAAQRRTIRAKDTLGDLFTRFFEEYAKHKRTADRITGMFELYLSTWRLRKLSTISHSDVVRLHSHIGKTRGKIVANRAVELLSSMFSQAKERWNWTGANPAADVRGFPEKKRKRFLQPDELPAFFQALRDELNETIRDYILLSLLCGQRRGNTQAMRWDEVNFQRATWTIPRTKNDESVIVPLTAPALGILQRRKQTASGPWVFPGRGVTGHLKEPKAAWGRILQRAGIEDLRLHDLRRTFGAYQACAGTSLPIIGESLGHKSLAATQIYARLNLDPVRASVTKATEAMLAAGGATALLGDGKA
jgi:integrase